MSNAYSFVLIDTTGTIPAATLQSIADACQWQAQGDVNNEWAATATMRTDTSTSNVKPGENAFIIEQSLPDEPDAVGYHATLPNGAPVAYFALSETSSLTSGDGSLSQCVSHEMCETLGDPGANRFALKKDGQTLQALELSDRVQDGWYNAPNSVAVSNFLLQSAFDPGAPGPWDKLNQLSDAEGRTSGGYEIDATIGQESQATGAAKLNVSTVGTPRKRAAHWSSRLSRRKNQAAVATTTDTATATQP